MARGMKPKKVVGKRGISYRTTVDVGTDPATGKRKQKVLTAKTKQQLETKVAQTLADVSRSVYFEPQKMTMGEYLDYWLKNYAKTNNEATTFERYETIVNLHLKPAFGATPVSRLTTAHVQDFIGNQLANGNKKDRETALSPTTVLYQFRILKEALSHAVKWEIVPKNVCDAVIPPRKEKSEVDALTAEEADKIVEALDGTYHQKITQIALYTAMRIGEILALTWDNVNLEKGYLLVTHSLRQLKDNIIESGPPKTESSKRQIDLEPEAVAVFRARKKEQAAERLAAGGLVQDGGIYQDRGFVFCYADGSPYKPKSYSSCWIDAVKNRLGIDVHPHQLRHTAVTLMLESGVPMLNVSKMLGHADIGTTANVYGHITPTGRRQAVRALAEALANGRK